MPLPIQNSLPSSCHHALGRRKLLIPKGNILSKICFPQQQKGWTKLYLFYQNSVRKYEDDLEHFFLFCMTCNFFKCDGFAVL